LPAYVLEKVEEVSDYHIGSKTATELQKKKTRKQSRKQLHAELMKVAAAHSDIEEMSTEDSPSPKKLKNTELQQVGEDLESARLKMKKLVRGGHSSEEFVEIRESMKEVSQLQQKQWILLRSSGTEISEINNATTKMTPPPASRHPQKKLPPLESPLASMPTEALCRLCDRQGLSRDRVEGRHDLLVLLGAAKATAPQQRRIDRVERERESKQRKKQQRIEIRANYDKHKRELGSS
jgi:hypothetical protein